MTDDQNRKIAVQIDLRQHGQLWEDFYDALIADARRDDEADCRPKISWEEAKEILRREGKL